MSDDFISKTFNDGKLVVIGIAGRNKQGHKEYSCFCSECANDPELFGNAIFRSTKGNLVNRGILPCGCSNRPKWSSQQYRVLISRRASGKYTAVVPDNVKNNKTRVQCKCNAEGCGHTWEASIDNLLNGGTGCKHCAGQAPITEDVATSKIQAICSEKGWIFNGFKTGWQNIRSKLLLTCHCGRSWDPSFANIIHSGSGCSSCAVSGYNPSLPGTFYVHAWTHPDTKHSFLKYGITNYPEQRIKQQKSKTNYIPKQLLSLDFQDGSIPPAIEKVIDTHKKQFQISNQVAKDIFPDGFSETLPTNTEEYNFVDNLVFQIAMCRMKPL